MLTSWHAEEDAREARECRAEQGEELQFIESLNRMRLDEHLKQGRLEIHDAVSVPPLLSMREDWQKGKRRLATFTHLRHRRDAEHAHHEEEGEPGGCPLLCPRSGKHGRRLRSETGQLVGAPLSGQRRCRFRRGREAHAMRTTTSALRSMTTLSHHLNFAR